MKRSDKEFQYYDICDMEFLGFICEAWNEGWFDEYSEDHFLIKILENRLDSFVGMTQLVNNNLNMWNFVDDNGNVNTKAFSNNFAINFSLKMSNLSRVFGKKCIEGFVKNQLSAGKHNYTEDTFFEALSEISILCFYSSLCNWDNCYYEPPKNGKSHDRNPEARFEIDSLSVNIEVKSPKFPHLDHANEKIVIPTILLSEKGRKLVSDYCKENNLTYIAPRVLKLKDFLNSAASKFQKPSEKEYSFLYINWSYSDFPSNSFLEAWALLTNPINGILRKPEYAESIGVELDVFDKISAVIVYTESLEGIVFSSFQHVWQGNGADQRFRMWVNEKMYPNNDSGCLDDIYELSRMNPTNYLNQYLMADFKSTNIDERAECWFHAKYINKLISENALAI